MKKIKSLLIILTNLLTVLCMAQTEFDDRVIINQINTKYPGFSVKTYQGKGGHSYMNMSHYGGTKASPLPTPANSHLGTIIYSGYDGQRNVQIGRIAVKSSGIFSAGNYPAKMNFQIGGTATCCGSNRMTIDGQTGNIGIGTTSPNGKLDIRLGGWNNFPRVTFNQTSNHPSIRLYRPTGTSNTAYPWWIENNRNLSFKSSNPANVGSETVSDIMTLSRNGNVTIYGKLEAKEIKVTLTPTADFVFEEDYNLPKLASIEKYIKKEKHLPEIASASEMKEKGVNIGDFQIQLLQKIEELTLYTIDQEKRLNSIEGKNKVLEKELKVFEKENKALEKENKVLKSLVVRMNKIEEQLKMKMGKH